MEFWANSQKKEGKIPIYKIAKVETASAKFTELAITGTGCSPGREAVWKYITIRTLK